MIDVRCIVNGGHPATLLEGASRPWGCGDVRSVPNLTASALTSRHPTRFALVDRVIRESVPVPVVPSGSLGGHHRSIVATVKSGGHDTYLGPMRAQEAAGAARPSVIEAIDARSRKVASGGD